MLEYLKLFLLLNSINLIWSKQEVNNDDDELLTKVITIKNYMFWPNGTIPFYIEPDHFDNEQAMSIMTALSIFAFKTCLKFLPVLDTPKENARVMTFVNPNGYRRCKIDTTGHSVFENFKVTVGYDCLKSPHIDMIIMKALGFPFEHNRLSRELYINVLIENIVPGDVELFTKDLGLPQELRALPYDINSVMHFGEREHSKNGHKTISFKNTNTKQHRQGLTDIDLKKIEIVYGEECRQRDRQEKLEVCQSYPGVVRRKRETDASENLKSLRVNPNITPPPQVAEPVPRASEVDVSENKISKSLKLLGVDEEAQTLIDNIFKLSSSALLHAREKLCKNKEPANLPSKSTEKNHTADIIGILELVGDYAIETVEKAISNLTIFCETPDVLAAYQRSCDFRIDSRCRSTYRSTKSGHVHYSTQHRPYIVQSTNIEHGVKYSYDKMSWRSGNDTEENTTPQDQVRRKREAPEAKKTSVAKEKLEKEKLIVKKKIKVTPATGNVTKDGLSANGIKRRYFERRKYKATKRTNKSESQWTASDVSSEKGAGVVSAARGKEIADVAEMNEHSASPQLEKGSKVHEETTDFGKKVNLISKEVSIVEENVADEVEKNESEAEVPATKQKSKNKIKIKDTFELMDKK